MFGDRGSVPMDSQHEMTYGESNGHVIPTFFAIAINNN